MIHTQCLPIDNFIFEKLCVSKQEVNVNKMIYDLNDEKNFKGFTVLGCS